MASRSQANLVFDTAAQGVVPSFADAWLGALAYTLQLYFDFSGYSDMAIGLGLLFGIRLPVNFNSPYQATSIIDFWRRWHMTLSAFLRDYLYVALGGNRHGELRRYVNLGLTMLLGGLWHGAGWDFCVLGRAAWPRSRRQPRLAEMGRRADRLARACSAPRWRAC
ncbi:MAG: hypothetical protein MZV49_01520 [Rhodopseudomonas palustris]|nr:hypothetical protein [Rhodopseudomonas palustris]